MKRNVFLLLAFYLFACTAYSQTTARTVTSFNEGWKFKKGPFAKDPTLFAAGFDMRWQDVNIPHTWNNTDMQNDKNNYYAGEAYYRKEYTPDASLKDKRIFLRFEGVGSVAEVYVNNTYVGNHKGAYSAFAVEITNALKFGEKNQIQVKVDNSSRPDVIPINHTLFGVYGGIYRPVELIVTNKVNIAVTDFASPGIYISQKKVTSKSADVNIKIKMENKNKTAVDVVLSTTVFEANGKVKAGMLTPVTVLPQGRQFVEQDFTLKNPHLWQGLEDPYLYKVVTQVLSGNKVIDEVVQPLGLRHFELKAADGMYLNGKKVPMYGVCRHQDWWKLGSALTNENHDTDLAIIKEIGATTIRFAHYQQSEYLYSKCDSIGFMIWAEIPFVNRVSTWEGENAKQQLIEMVRQNYNHPSIYVWGLHNEVYTPYDYTVALTTDLHDLAKSEDPYRYTVSVSGYSKVDQASNLNADIQGINHYFGWYSGKIQDVEKWITGMEKDFPNYKVMFSEYGAEANIHQQEEVVGDFGRWFSQFYPETFATKFHEIHWGVISQHPYLIGSYIWNTFDFATPATTQGGVEARNMKGLVTFDRKTKKDPYYWYKANWSKEPVLYLTQRRATQRENKVTPVTVYSNMGTPKLYVNGVEVTNVTQGTTHVHYIFNNIELNEGENTIITKVTANGKEHEDKVVWNYSPENRKLLEKATLKTKEHIGL
ncbi:glycoside hydrolase family 2 protein [Bacteroides sp. 519]|uniref:glycoside hydrolase family 2 protein n=1 Tax=Bacteroides sp. 519 TaxID=2302937 RepID=UPI0013D73749|nr:glycoside hydrolase family 2 TIM barrel-domain containing protein [Bacteroides sp. 519]NDV59062.1 beta-galactosidase [Bacteroides sp. 519]